MTDDANQQNQNNQGNWQAVAAFILGLGFGALAALVISYAVQPRCPVCNEIITKGTLNCPHCQASLRWN